MSVVVVDTSVWIEFFRGITIPELETALRESRVVLPPLVVSELFSGKSTGKNLEKLKLLVSQLGIIQTDLAHWMEVGMLRKKLALKGISVSTPDAHVAYCAISLNAELASIDGIFKKISTVTTLKIAALL